MVHVFRRIFRDLRNGRNIDAYVLTVIIVVFAVLGFFDDKLDDDLRWAAVLAALGVLLYRATLPETATEPAPDLLHDRSVFEQRPLSETFANARDVRVYAPSAVNLLSAETCDVLRRTVLARRNGSVRVVVLDPEEKDALRLAARQLDDSVEFPVQRLPASLESTLERLELMSRWTTNGSFEYRLLPYNPGFSLVLLDPETSHGRAIVEIHGFHNTATPARMHLELTRDTSERWYAYWVEQFDHIWEAARSPLTPSG
jgi:hypothetical protein